MVNSIRVAFCLCLMLCGSSTLAADPWPVQDTTKSGSDAQVILFFGDSLTAGYGLDPAQAFPALIQEKINTRGWNFHATNAGLRGLPVEGAKQNLQAIIDRTKSKYPAVKVVLVGMQVPSNLGRDYTTHFRAIFPDLAAANSTALIPFLLDGVGGVPALNLPDGIHPTPAGHKIVAENVWKVLELVLRTMQ